jgi:tetratricopeptide (TPR) repeat protein
MSRTLHLASLMRLELRQRWARGDRVPVEDYIAQYPSLRTDAEAVLDLIYHEVVLRQEQGETPTLAEYLARFDDLGPQLRLLFEVDHALGAVSFGQGLSPLEIPLLAGADQSITDEDLFALAEPESLLPTVPGYEVLTELGRGGMSVVYLARHVRLKRLVALKVLLAGAQASPAERARFRIEGEAVARLDHQNIVRIYEVGDHIDPVSRAARPFFALEYADGGTLEERTAGTPQPAEEAVRLVETLARAIQYAHERGILHRDLKPSNILLAPDIHHPKIADFGLARLLDAHPDLTPTLGVLGTPSYMAPEQAAGRARESDGRADVYGLGAILYKLLTGRPPFLGTNVLRVLERVRNQEPTRPRHLRPDLAADLETICLKCLEKEPAQRYASALELAEDLRRFLDGQSIQARPVPAWERLVRSLRRQPVLWARALAGCVGLVLILVVWWYAGAAGRLAQATADERERQFARHRDDAFFYGLLATSREDSSLAGADQATNKGADQSTARGLFTGPEAAVGVTAAETAARTALHLAGVETGVDRSAPARAAGIPPPQLPQFSQPSQVSDCYALLLILADTRGFRPQRGEPDRERYREALDLLDRARQLGGHTRASHLRRARFLECLGEPEAARRERARAETLAPRTALEHFWIGEGLYRKGDWATAQAAFQRALAVEPTHFWAQFFLAVCHLRLGQWETARAGLTGCLARRPDFVWGYLFRSLASEKAGAADEAEADFENALRLRPGRDASYVLLLARGCLRFQQKEFSQAEADFRAARDLKPGQYNAYINLAQVCLARQDFDQAGQEFERALARDPPALVICGYHVDQGRRLWQKGERQAALRAFDAARNALPEHPLPHGLRGAALLALERNAEAASAYDEYFRVGGDRSAEAFRNRGLARMRLGKYPEAVDDYSRALDRQPDGATYQDLGWAHLFSDAAVLALRDFEKAVDLQPQVADSYTGRGLALVLLGRYREAIVDADVALRLETQEPIHLRVGRPARLHNIACIWAQASERVSADKTEPARERRAAEYAAQSLAAIRRALDLLAPAERRAFWEANVLADKMLGPVRAGPGFRKLERDYFPAEQPGEDPS